MEKHDTGHTIRIHPAESTSLPFRNFDDPEEQEQVDHQEHKTADEPEGFAERSKDEIGMLLGYIFSSCLGSFQKSPPR